MKVGGRESEAPAALTTQTSGTPVGMLAKRAGRVVLAAAVLFFCYWRQSQSAPLSSDDSRRRLHHHGLEHEPADQARLTKPLVTCTGRGAWPPPAARARHRRRSGRDKASSDTAAAWRPVAPAPSGTA